MMMNQQLRLGGNAEDKGRERLRQIDIRNRIAERAGHGDQHHDRRVIHHGHEQRVAERLERHLAIDKHADQDRVNHRERARLRRRTHAEANTDNQDDRENQRPDGFLESAQQLLSGQLGRIRIRRVVFLTPCGQIDREHQREHHQNARNDARRKQTTNGNLADKSINNQTQRGQEWVAVMRPVRQLTAVI